MAISKKNQGLLNLVKRVHGVVENVDIEKHRQSQDQIGALFGQNKSILIREADIDGMYGEWLCVNRAHMKKYVILYCQRLFHRQQHLRPYADYEACVIHLHGCVEL